jgi:hypothetical protein
MFIEIGGTKSIQNALRDVSRNKLLRNKKRQVCAALGVPFSTATEEDIPVERGLEVSRM